MAPKTLAPLLATLNITLAIPASAQSVLIGLGYADFSSSSSNDEALLSLEYQHNPFLQSGRWIAGWAGNASVHFNGDVFLGVGIYGE